MKSSSIVASCVVAVLVACGGGNADQSQPQTAHESSAAASSSTTSTSAAPAASSAPATASTVLSADDAHKIVSASDRTDDDRKLDIMRNPEQFLLFAGVLPGMHVADLGAGGGYTTELLARAVGPTGKVYAQNDPDLVKRFLDKPMTARLARPVNSNVVRTDRTFDDPLPADAKNLDFVVMYIFYHDVVWIGADRDKMNKAIFAALRPGGTYIVVDASAKSGAGTNDAKTLHRIEEGTVKSEVQKAGFTFAASGSFLRNPSDARDWNSSPGAAGDRRGSEDRFALKFTKP